MFFESQVGTIGDRERRKRKSKDGEGKRLKFTEDRNERQSGKTDEKAGKTSGDRLFRLLRTLYRFEGSPKRRERDLRIPEPNRRRDLNAP